MHTIGILLLAAATTGDGFGYGQPSVGWRKLFSHHTVMHGPAPAGGPIMSVPGAVPAGGAAAGRRFPNVRSQIFFLDPDEMKIGWQTGGANGERVYMPAQLTVPARYNFLQGYIYRLKLTDIPGRPGVQLYPTIEVAPSTPATDAYLTHNPIPVQFTAEDFDQVIDGGNFVTKVIYLPDPKYQELAIQGVETLVSTRLEPGVDPILEADKRGTILLIVRLGAIDLEMPGQAVTGPVAGAPAAPVAPAGTVLPPGALPPGVMTGPQPPVVPLETAPATALPATTPAPAPAPAPSTATPPIPAPTTPPPAEGAKPATPAPPAANPPGGQVLAPPPSLPATDASAEAAPTLEPPKAPAGS